MRCGRGPCERRKISGTRQRGVLRYGGGGVRPAMTLPCRLGSLTHTLNLTAAANTDSYVCGSESLHTLPLRTHNCQHTHTRTLSLTHTTLADCTKRPHGGQTHHYAHVHPRAQRRVVAATDSAEQSNAHRSGGKRRIDRQKHAQDTHVDGKDGAGKRPRKTPANWRQEGPCGLQWHAHKGVSAERGPLWN